MWKPRRRGSSWLGTLRYAEEQPPRRRGGAARAHKVAAGNWKSACQAMGTWHRLDMGAATGLARRLRAALLEEEPRAVEELLRRGADPNLVLVDGAAAIHLAARARYPRGLCCLQALLRGGGDPNTRSAEALTPLHVAAAWGCRRGLELLLSQGADPTLRDQDGLRPLDLALRQGHVHCARVLRELDARTRTRTRAETQEPEPEPEPEPGSLGLSGPPDRTLDSAALQTQLGRGDGSHVGLEAGPGSPSLPASLGVADKDRSSASPLGRWDCSSDESFVTAVEVSGAEDLAPDTSPWAGSLPQTRQGLPLGVRPTQRVPRSLDAPPLAHVAQIVCSEAELNADLQALTLTSPDAASFPSSSSTSLRDGGPAGSPPQTLPPEPSAFHIQTDDQTSLDSGVAALWLTEDEASSTDDRDPVPCCWHLPVPAMSDSELLQGPRTLGKSPGPVTPFPRRYYLQRLEEAQVAPGPDFSGHSPELAEALRTGRISHAQADEDALAQQFERPDPTRKWREGVVKSSFTYLLLDPRETQDLPARAFSLTPAECLQTFVRAIFYVGKGTRARPYVHLWEALGHHGRPGKQACPKVRQISDIWASGRGVISLHCFQHVVAVEAYTREACLVDALGIQMLANQKQGHCYGVVAGWPPARRRRLGVHLLHRALLVFLAEGERELRPQDIQARG
ncbi:PREDICTED: ankyrin repeat and LEM domain-containing protein 1 [Propithecus coquereli]|uniref:ankyrin repeat and LEM domain-containing protein 1 n=1 Tax=Propithecus coquereli TaxID=379532 RepID=UPI00063F7565|nr:PREDICTED: ankyrin repeat and LEM domain-containing protein 1 [Propithecus coquereli]